jgi:hypothetical protein
MTWAGSVAILGLVTALAYAPTSSVALAIDITALMPMPDAALRTMVSETEALWKPHGVAIRWSVVARRDPLARDEVKVVNDGCGEPICLPLGTNAGVARPPATLGAVVFVDGSTTPENTLMLSVDTVVQSLDSVKWQNRRLADLPGNSRDHLIGRALGRVLAHEIGHYLLASRFHAQDGLMRPEFRADQLIALSRQGFKLSETHLPLLRYRLAQLANRPPEVARNEIDR